MAIREKLVDGSHCYEVSINLRSKIKPDLRVQKLRTLVPSLKAAKGIERELLKEAAMELARKEGSGIPWLELVERWELAHRSGELGLKKLQLSTIWETVGVLRKFTQDWNAKTCQEITPGDVRKILVAMEESGYSQSRLKALKGSVNVIFNWGISDGHLVGVRSSPADGLMYGRVVEEKPPDILTMTDIQKLLGAAKEMDHEWYPVWAMALQTGMRSGELYALEWSDVDFESGMITVSKSYNKKMNTVKCTKAGYWRKVPISEDLERLLRTMKLSSPGEGQHVLPRIGKWRRGESAKVLKEFCEGIGVRPVCFHALRACFATHMLNAGVSSPVVKKVCGWTEEKVMNRYIRLAGIDVRGATDVLKVMPSEENGKGGIVQFKRYTSSKVRV